MKSQIPLSYLEGEGEDFMKSLSVPTKAIKKKKKKENSPPKQIKQHKKERGPLVDTNIQTDSELLDSYLKSSRMK